MRASRIKGFTIVELLVIVVVITILTAITVASYSNAANRSKSASVSSTLTMIDKAFKSWASTNNLSRWPPDAVQGGGGTTLQERIDDKTTIPWTNFSSFLPKVPSDAKFGTQAWYYDQDEDVPSNATAHYEYCVTARTDPTCTADDKPTCSTTEGQKLQGVNIVIQWLTAGDELTAKSINDSIDGSAESDWKGCGKIRWYFDSANNRYAILYSISNTKAI